MCWSTLVVYSETTNEKRRWHRLIMVNLPISEWWVLVVTVGSNCWILLIPPVIPYERIYILTH